MSNWKEIILLFHASVLFPPEKKIGTLKKMYAGI